MPAPTDAAPGSPVLRYAAPLLLVAVALTQAVLTQSQDMTPWKGGGFGMFASPDRSEHRAVRAYLRTPDGELPVVLTAPDGATVLSDRLILRARNLPTDAAVGALAAQIAGTDWVPERQGDAQVAVARQSKAAVVRAAGEDDSAGGAAGTPQDAVRGRSVPVESVRVEVWKLGFDRDAVEIVPTKLADVTRAVG